MKEPTGEDVKKKLAEKKEELARLKKEKEALDDAESLRRAQKFAEEKKAAAFEAGLPPLDTDFSFLGEPPKNETPAVLPEKEGRNAEAIDRKAANILRQGIKLEEEAMRFLVEGNNPEADMKKARELQLQSSKIGTDDPDMVDYFTGKVGKISPYVSSLMKEYDLLEHLIEKTIKRKMEEQKESAEAPVPPKPEDIDNRITSLDVPLPPPHAHPELTVEPQQKKEEVIKNLRKAIENAQKVLEKNKVEREAIKRRLAELDRAGKETVAKPEIKTFSAAFVEDSIAELLRGVSAVKEIQKVKVSGRGNQMDLDMGVVAEKGVTAKVGIKAVIENSGGVFSVKDYKIDAGMIIRMAVKKLIEPELNNIGNRIKDYIEKKEGKKPKKVEIEGGQLKVTF